MEPRFLAKAVLLDAHGNLWCDLDQVERFVEKTGAVEMHYHCGSLEVVSVIPLEEYGVRKVRPFYASSN